MARQSPLVDALNRACAALEASARSQQALAEAVALQGQALLQLFDEQPGPSPAPQAPTYVDGSPIL